VESIMDGEDAGPVRAKLPILRRLLASGLPNPGKFEDVNAEARKMFTLNSFEGLRLEYQRGLSQSFGVGHNINLQPAQDQFGTYDFAANFSSGKHLLLSQTQTNGDLQARYILSATENLTMQIQSQLTKTPHQSNAVVNVDYKGSDWSLTAKAGSYAQFGLSYLQSVTRNLSLGLDFMYVGKLPMNQPPFYVSTGALRYSTNRFALVSMLTDNRSQNSLDLTTSYVQRVRDNLTFGTELKIDLPRAETTCSLGYEYSSPLGAFKTNITTDGKITSLFEKTLSEISGITFSAEVDNAKKSCKFGVGFQLLQ